MQRIIKIISVVIGNYESLDGVFVTRMIGVYQTAAINTAFEFSHIGYWLGTIKHAPNTRFLLG